MRSLGNEELGWGLCPQTPGIDRFAARMNGRRHGPPPAIPAAESALGLRPRRALSSAQLFSEWITSTPPCNRIAANGDYPLNCLSHDWGSLQFSAAPPGLEGMVARIPTVETVGYYPSAPPGRNEHIGDSHRRQGFGVATRQHATERPSVPIGSPRAPRLRAVAGAPCRCSLPGSRPPQHPDPRDSAGTRCPDRR